MSKAEEKKLLSDYKKIVETNKQNLFVNTEWQVKNGMFTKFSLYSDSPILTSTSTNAKSLTELKM